MKIQFRTSKAFKHLASLYSTTLLLTLHVSGQEATNLVPQSGWTRNITIGATATRGNSRTILSSGSFSAERKCGDIDARFGLEANYGEAELTATNGTKTTESNVNNAKIFAEVRKTLGSRTYLYTKADALTDRIGGIDYRLILGPGFGYYILKNEIHELSIDIGISYIREVLKEKTEDNPALRASERYDFKISKTAKLWETIEYLPGLNDFNRFLMNAEIGIEAAINTSLSLRMVAQEKYNSEPPAGKEKNDLIFISGIVLNF